MTTERAAVYCRISDDSSGEALGVGRQRDDCLALAKRRGFTVAPEHVYTDNDIGASTRSRSKRRAAYEAMLTAARGGEFDVIVSYSNSRLTRRPAEYEQLISLYEQHGVRIVTVASGSADLSTADGRLTARLLANIDAAEAERTSERIKRANFERARRGLLTPGNRPWGWQAGAMKLDPVESRELRTVIEHVLAGASLSGECSRMNSAGVLTATGKTWRTADLTTILRRPRLCGRVVYHGQVLEDDHGQPILGQWEPLITPAEFDRLQATLTARAGENVRTGRRPGAWRFLGSGLVTCGLCGHPMAAECASTRPKYRAYRCGALDHPRNRFDGQALDTFLAGVVVARLADVTPVAREAAPWSGQAELADVEKRLSDVRSGYASGSVSPATFFSVVPTLERRHKDLRSQRDAHDLSAERADLSRVTPESWDGMTLAQRQRLARALVATVIVAPKLEQASRSEHRDLNRLTIVWRDG